MHALGHTHRHDIINIYSMHTHRHDKFAYIIPGYISRARRGLSDCLHARHTRIISGTDRHPDDIAELVVQSLLVP